MKVDVAAMKAVNNAWAPWPRARHTAAARVRSSMLKYDYLGLVTLADDVSKLIGEACHRAGAEARVALDLGSDLSPYSGRLKDQGWKVETLDIETGAGGDHVGTVEQTGLPDSSYRLVLCTQVIEHCLDPWAALHELHRIVRPGGYLIWTVPQVWFYHPHPDDNWRFTPVGVTRLSETSGFEVEQIHVQGGPVATSPDLQHLRLRSRRTVRRPARNEKNLGLSLSVKRALAAVETDYVLTCYVDCVFVSDDYVVDARDLPDRHPDVGVASGQPVADVEAGLLRPEKVYLTAYLMDIFPDDTREPEPVGFAEGRCDAFRMKALREVGLYHTTVRRAGEDLVMAARLRRAGYRVCRAPGLRYYLSVSSQQDSLLNLVRHARVVAQVTPYIFFGNRGTLAGVVGASAGPNRQRRALLRVL
jgi:SAM-dependent methyltransferase